MKNHAKHIELILVLFICALSSTYAEALKYECPEPEDIYPCFCEEDGEPTVSCNHFTTSDQINTSIKGLSGHKIYKLLYFMNKIDDPIHPDTFKDVNVENIMFENSTINLQPPQFQGMENHLSNIHLRACFSGSNPIGTWSLKHLTKLRELTLEKNRIIKLPNEWLESVPDTLRTVTLEDNNIVSLGDQAFAKIRRLTFMILDGNRLLELKRSMFPSPADDLRSLSLNSNRLRFLSYGLFEDMPNLRIVEMLNNRLTTLEEKVWSGVILQLTKLDLSENEFECDRHMKWIYTGQSRPLLFYGQCSQPEKLKGKALKALTVDDFNEA